MARHNQELSESCRLCNRL